MFSIRRRKQTDVVLSILFVLLMIVLFRLVSMRLENFDDVTDDESNADELAEDEQRIEQSDDIGKANDLKVQGLLDDSSLDETQRQIRKLLVLPNSERSTSAGSGTAESGRGHRRRGRRGRRKGRRKRRGRGRGGGIGTAAAAGGRRGDFSQHGQSRFVDGKLKGLVGGFFIESGASDGETGSNSMFFEVERNWTGLLIEPNPKSFEKLKSKKRRAYGLNACLSPTGTTSSVRFKPAGGIGGIVDHMPPGHRQLVDHYGFHDVNITCFSLYDIIRSLPIDVNRINYWSLDVEGAELPILERIDWAQLVPIDVISIEFKVKDSKGQTDQQATAEKLLALRKLFDRTKLYRELGKIRDVDIIFGRTDAIDSATLVDQTQGVVDKKDSKTETESGKENGEEGQTEDDGGETEGKEDQEEKEGGGQDGEADKDYGKDGDNKDGGQDGEADKDDGEDGDNKDGGQDGEADKDDGEDGDNKDGGDNEGENNDEGK